MIAHGFIVTDDHIEACVEAIKKKKHVCLHDIALVAKELGVPWECETPKGTRYPAERLADKLLQRLKKENKIRLTEKRSTWEWLGTQAPPAPRPPRTPPLPRLTTRKKFITYSRCERIARTLMADRAASRLLGPAEHTIYAPGGIPHLYSKEVLTIAKSLEDQDLDPLVLTMRQILQFSVPILTGRPDVKQKLNKPAMSSNNVYLLEDFTAVNGKEILEPTRAFLHAIDDVISAMDQAKREGLKIRVQQLGVVKTVVDWTK